MKKTLLILLTLATFLFGQSVNQKYNKTRIISGAASKSGDSNFLEYIVKSNDGKELYRILDRVDYDIPYSKLEVFNDGSAVLISAFNGVLTFIDNKGSKTGSEKIDSEIQPKYERSIQSVADGESLVIVVPESNEKSATVKMYKSNGTIVSDFEIPFGNLNGVAYSSKLGMIFISYNEISNSGNVGKKIALFNNNGDREKTFKGEFQKGFFTDDNQFVGFSNRNLISINAGNTLLNFKKEAPKGSLFLDVAEYNNAVVAIVASSPLLIEGKWFYENPTSETIDFSGNLIDTKNITTGKFSEYKFLNKNNELNFSVGNKTVRIK